MQKPFGNYLLYFTASAVYKRPAFQETLLEFGDLLSRLKKVENPIFEPVLYVL